VKLQTAVVTWNYLRSIRKHLTFGCKSGMISPGYRILTSKKLSS